MLKRYRFGCTNNLNLILHFKSFCSREQGLFLFVVLCWIKQNHPEVIAPEILAFRASLETKGMVFNWGEWRQSGCVADPVLLVRFELAVTSLQ